MHNRLSGFLLVGLAAGFAGCGGDSLTLPPTTGELEITTTTGGTEPDADGYTVQIDARQPQAIGAAATIRVSDLEPGTHNVLLTGMAANCSIAGENPRTLTITAGETTTAAFELTCGGTTGALEITVQTSGDSPDADGYAISLDGTDRGPIAANAVVTLGSLAPGSHVVGLTGLSANCTVDGDNLRAATVTPGSSTPVTFAVTCVAPPPSSGVLRVTTTTTGDDPDNDGYLFAVDGGEGQPIGTNTATNVDNTAAGTHTVVLSSIAGNCTVSGGPSKQVTVPAGGTGTVAFAITCGALPPTTGSIRITTSTSGSDVDINGYQFTIDGGSPQAIQVSETQTVANIPAGAHTVVISGLADNCDLSGNPSRNVSLAAGETEDVDYSITCTSTAPPPPSASESRIVADPKNIATGGTSTITVTVRDADRDRLQGVTVSLSSTGTDNTITPASATTDEDGVATFTFSSTAGGDKTITATANGVTLNDTEVIVVSRRSSSIQITGDANDPSGPGETITVTFSVAFDGGGIPTGTVDIFSLEEALVGCTVDVSAGSCTFALNTPGLHHLQASYSGDNQFVDSSDPDGEEHNVSSPVGINLGP
jgi:hypothetical protein